MAERLRINLILVYHTSIIMSMNFFLFPVRKTLKALEILDFFPRVRLCFLLCCKKCSSSSTATKIGCHSNFRFSCLFLICSPGEQNQHRKQLQPAGQHIKSENNLGKI